ncbi:MAG: metalloregulator ArsR/SmtB family transcription factor [Chitinispirillia bacterium]|jgi:ArsR family transcriptional regulator
MNELNKIAEIYKVFSDPTRLKILKLLLDNKFLCVNAITKRLDISQSAVSQHLRVLRQINLVENNRMACHIHYSLNKDRLIQFNEEVSRILGKEFFMR